MSRVADSESDFEEEEDQAYTSDGDAPDFLTPGTADQDDEEIAYYAKKLGIDPDVDEWDDYLRDTGFSKILKDITAGSTPKSKQSVPMVKAVRTDEEESARRDFTGLLNRIAPSNFPLISSRIRDAFASHPPPVSISMFTRCLTQRILADAPLPPHFIDCYSRVLREVPDSIETVIGVLSSPEKVTLLNVRPFLDALGAEVVESYGKSDDRNTESMQLAQVARQMHMTTDLRRNLFYAITTAIDVVDAFAKISKLQLSKTQQKDVPMVIIECCRKESSYNPFYAALAIHFVEFDKHFQKNFRAALKNTIKLMPGFVVAQIRNVALFVDELIQKGAFDLTLLKGVSLMTLSAQPLLFAKILVREVFQKLDPGQLLEQMNAIAQAPNFAADLRQFLDARLRPFVEKQANFPGDRKRLIGKSVSILASVS
jgi:nucleolar MIF4G domain-containing protein 1